MKFFIVLSCVAWTAISLAEVKVKQLVPSLNRAAVESTANTLAVGDTLLAENKGRQCQLPVIQVKNGIAQIDTSKCEFEDKLKIGQSLEKSLLHDIVKAEPQRSPETLGLQVNTSKLKKVPNNSSQECLNSTRDLRLKPCKSQLLFSPALNYGQYKRVRKYSFSSNSNVRESEYSYLEMSFDYGLSNETELELYLEHLVDHKGEVKYTNGAKEDFKYEGFSDPWIFLNHRFLRQNTNTPVTLDVGLGYSPKVISAEEPTDGKVAANGRGTDASSLSALTSKRFSNYLGGLSVSYMYTGNGDIKYLNSGQSADFRGSSRTGISLLNRYYFSDKFRVSGNLTRQEYNPRASGFDRYNRDSLNLGMRYSLSDKTILSASTGITQYDRPSRTRNDGVRVKTAEESSKFIWTGIILAL